MQESKERVALTSIAASGGLTIAKAVVGLLSGSLALLSEAAHSALDFAVSLKNEKLFINSSLITPKAFRI